jgi:hypothetical protein
LPNTIAYSLFSDKKILTDQWVEQTEKVFNMATEHTFIGKNGPKTKALTGMSAIREKCLDCCGWNAAEVRRCPCGDCALYLFRFGKYPKSEKIEKPNK